MGFIFNYTTSTQANSFFPNFILVIPSTLLEAAVIWFPLKSGFQEEASKGKYC